MVECLNEEFVNNLSQVLSRFEIPDNTEIELATKQLRELSNHRIFIPSLFYILSNNQSVQVRQLSAVVLRRKLVKSWKLLDPNTKLAFRQAVLTQLTVESNEGVLRSVMQLVGCISKFEIASNGWPDLMMFIDSSVKSSDVNNVRHASHLLSVICDSSADHLSEHYNNILNILSQLLNSTATSSAESAYYAVQAFNHLVPFLGDDQGRLVRPLVLKSVQVIKKLLEVDESRAAELIEIFESLIETEVAFISPYVKDLVLFTLQISGNIELEDETRIRAMSLLQWIIKIKKKAILKHNLIDPILNSLCPIIVSSSTDDDENDESGLVGDSAESQTPLASSLQVIDDMALHLPPEKLYNAILPFIKSCLVDGGDEHRRGLLLTLACLAEGTSEFIKNNHLESFVKTVCDGASSPNPRVRNASMFALGQFSEHLQPDISRFAPQVMPILFSLLQQLSSEAKASSALTKTYYALENFVEDLGPEILPYLDPLMKHLLNSLMTSSDIHSKELAVSAIGAVVNAAKENIRPYLDEILPLLQECLSKIDSQIENKEGELNILHTQALDTLGVLMRTVGRENLQLAEDCLKLGMSILSSGTSDPDLKRSAFGLFSALASIVGENMSPFLKVIVTSLITSAQSTEGIIAHFAENGDSPSNADFSFLDDSTETDLDNDDDDLDDDDGVEAFSVENSFMDEKSDACETLGDLAKYCPRSFLPYMEGCFDEVFKQVDFPHSDVRKSSIASCGQITMTSFREQSPLFPKFLSQLFPILCKTIEEDTERLVVMTTLLTTQELVSTSGGQSFANQEDDLKLLMSSVVKVLQQKSACQDEEIDDEDDQQAEYDEMLVEYCGEIFPTLASKLGCVFLPYFITCLPTFINKMKPSSSVAERSFSCGTVAETVEKLGPGSTVEILPHLVPRLIQLTRDTEAEVRNNAIYGLGVVLQHGGDSSTTFYPDALTSLSQALCKETNRRVVDNLLGAVSRLILTNQEAVPLEQVVPVLIQNLPIREDHDEDAISYACLARLLRHNKIGSDVTVVMKIVRIFAKVLLDDVVDDEVKSSISEELRHTSSRDMKSFERVCELLDDESRSVVQRIITS